MRKKSGESEIGYLQGLSLGLIVLSVVLLGFYLHYSGFLTGISNFLPDFGNEPKEKVEYSLLRYDLIQGDVQYYDNAYWIPFKTDKQGFAGKEIDKNDLIAKFQNWWYSKENRPVFELKKLSDDDFRVLYPPSEFNYKNELRVVPPLFYRTFAISKSDKLREDYEIGWDILLNPAEYLGVAFSDLVSRADQRSFIKAEGGVTSFVLLDSGDRPFGFLFLDLRDNIIFGNLVNSGAAKRNILEVGKLDQLRYSSEEDYSKYSSLEIRRDMIEWRDSIFEKPLNLNGDWYCLKEFDNRYLYLDLKKPIKEGEKGKC